MPSTLASVSPRLQEQAALYAAGLLTAREATEFELVLEFCGDLRTQVAELQEIVATATLASQRNDLRPSGGLKDRILAQVLTHPQQRHEQGFVISDADGLVEWVNPEFTAMCGYTLDELRGKKLGPLLQGELTDRTAAARLREAVRDRRPCTEALVNYHKQGRPYWVSINVTPLFDNAGTPLCMVARELVLPERRPAEQPV